MWITKVEDSRYVVYNGFKWIKVGEIIRFSSTDYRRNLFDISKIYFKIFFMFIGEYQHNIDDKGRLAIPVKFRKDLIKGAVVTKGLDDCLFLYPKKEWHELARKLAGLPISQANTRAFARLMLAGAMDVEIDKQGRIILPEYLRRYGFFAKKVIIAGLYNRLEIWAEERWENYKKINEKNSVEIAEKLGELGV